MGGRRGGECTQIASRSSRGDYRHLLLGRWQKRCNLRRLKRGLFLPLPLVESAFRRRMKVRSFLFRCTLCSTLTLNLQTFEVPPFSHV